MFVLLSQLHYITIFIIPFIFLVIYDIIKSILTKSYKNFNGYGLHIYVGMFGAGKTSAMVHDAYKLAKHYPQMTILTNMKLQNFPQHTKIIQMEDTNDIVTAPPDTLVIIDEISSVFNSRKYKTDGIPAPLLSMLLQVRKERKMIFATAQRFQHVDALLRQITFTVRICSCWCGRLNWIRSVDAWEYENRVNALIPCTVLNLWAFLQTDKIRNLYDTTEMVDEIKKIKFMTDEEILARQQPNSNVIVQERKKSIF